MKPLYKRILLKLSGEGLAGDEKTGINQTVLHNIASQVRQIHEMDIDICIVVGGGNIFRGAKEAAKGMDRSIADQVGMLSTVINALCLQNTLENIGVKTYVMSGLNIPSVCENYVYRQAISHLQQHHVLIFAGGTGNPYFTTDTGAALRAVEMKCDALLKATQVNGVYSADPKEDKTAVKYNEISYDKVIVQGLKVMDLTAISLAKDNKLPIVVFAQEGMDSLQKAVCGQGEFTIIK